MGQSHQFTGGYCVAPLAAPPWLQTAALQTMTKGLFLKSAVLLAQIIFDMNKIKKVEFKVLFQAYGNCMRAHGSR